MKMNRKEFSVLAGPSMMVMIILMIVPLTVTVLLSFCSYQLGSTPTWVGLRNYKNILTANGNYWAANFFTLGMILASLPIKVLIGYLLAQLLYRVKSKVGKTVFISGALIPYIITPVAGTMMFAWLFKDGWGVLDYALTQLGIDIPWFAESFAARALVFIHQIWGGCCFPFLVYYSALQVMPADPLKAAEVEGATWFQKARYITLPYLAPLTLFVVMMGVMDGYRLYDSVAILTKGGPGNATQSVQYLNYQMAFNQGNYGQACAMSVLMVIVIFLLMAPFIYRMYREHVEGGK